MRVGSQLAAAVVGTAFFVLALVVAAPLSAWAQPVPSGETSSASTAVQRTTAPRGASFASVTAETVIALTPVAADVPTSTVPVLASAPDLHEFAGLRVTSVAVEVEDGDATHAPPEALTTMHVGDAFTPSAGRRALDQLLATGRFARGRVTVNRDGTGAKVVLHVVPRSLIGRLRLELHGARVDRDELLRTADLVDGGEIVPADVAIATRRIERYFELRGYPQVHAQITVRETNDPMRAFVTVNVTPGAPRILDDRRFYVSNPHPELLLATAESYSVRIGQRSDEPALDRADAALSQALRAKGWYKATVSHDLVWMGVPPKGGRIVLRVRIDAGPLFAPRFVGNEHFDADVLTSVLGLDTETDRSPTHLADRVRAFYIKRGFLDVEVRAETRSAAQDPVELVVFHIREHARVRVTGRTYPCLKLSAIRNLHSGGPRSPAAIGTEIDSFLDEELPGADFLVSPNPVGLGKTIGSGAGQVATGSRPVPIDLSPDSTYAADTYDRAAEHIRELYRNEGFLHAEVGPVQVVRAACDPHSPANRCIPLPIPPQTEDVCTYDHAGLPLPVESLSSAPSAASCRPDATRGIECAPTVQIVLPIKLGPRTRLWDIAFTGVKSASEHAVENAAQLPLGEPANTGVIEDARRRIVDWYKELGFYYVDVKYALEPSADNTRTRVRFDISEGDPVTVRDIVIHGLENTREGIVRRRIALEVGRPFRTSDARTTEERIATLGVFSSVTVSLSDPYVPQANKDVIIEVVERDSQYIELRPGFSTGEGVRGALEYGHRNLLGDAWQITIHLQASYLPDFLILDPQVAANYGQIKDITKKIATRNTVTMAWPEVGLGPTVRAQVDGIYVRDLERDFTLFKASALGTLLWRPFHELQISGGPGYENNSIFLFSGGTINQFLSLMQNEGNTDLQRLLRVPDGESNVAAGRIAITWDRRDNAFNAHRGTYVSAGLEQVNSYPVRGTADPSEQFQSHFVRLTQTAAAYLPITSTVTFAAELRLGEISNLGSCVRPFYTGTTASSTYCTYPDRLFFMGGFDSMRGWLQDTFIPQEYADRIAADASKPASDTTKFTVDQIPIRGGNLMINPRFELRFPVRAPFDAALFADFGNLWNDPSYITSRALTLRADVGAGVRVDTPVGPLVFDYGLNVTRRSYEDLGAFHFAIGLF